MDNTESRPVPFLYALGLVSFMLFFLEVEVAWNYFGIIFKYIAALSLTVHLFQSFSFYDQREKLVIALVGILVILVGINAQQLTLLFLSFALVVGAKGLDFKEILKIHFVTGLTIFLISLVGSKMGLIENKAHDIGIESMDMLGTSSSRRYSYGYVWPTACAIHVSFICIVYWLYRDGLLKIKEWIVFIAVFWFVFHYVKARQSALILLLMICITLYLHYNNKRNRTPSRIFMFLLVLVVPLLAFIMMYATLAYDDGDMNWIAVDLLLTGRLNLGQEALDDFGISWFGQYVQMIGGDVNTFDYNYVDSSYVQAYLLWGIVLTTILLLSYVLICIKAFSRRDIAMLFAVLFAALSSVTSQYLFQLMSCPLLIALFSEHPKLEQNIDYVEQRTIEEADT